MIPTYNSSLYLEETLRSVLMQDPGDASMQIAVVDNGSTDDTAGIVARLGGGRIAFFQNEQNIGMMRNFNKCIELAKGELIHILNSDDVVLPGFYSRYASVFEAHPTLGLLSSGSELMDEESRHLGETPPFAGLETPSRCLAPYFYENPVRTPAVVVRASAYYQVGGFDVQLVHAADWDLWMRVIDACTGMHLNEIWARYRVHVRNATSQSYLTGRDLLDMEQLFLRMQARGYKMDEKRFWQVLFKTAFNTAINFRLRWPEHAPRAWALAMRYEQELCRRLPFFEKLSHRVGRTLFLYGKVVKNKFLKPS